MRYAEWLERRRWHRRKKDLVWSILRARGHVAEAQTLALRCGERGVADQLGQVLGTLELHLDVIYATWDELTQKGIAPPNASHE